MHPSPGRWILDPGAGDVSVRARGNIVAPKLLGVSRTVKDLVPGSGLAFYDAGEHELKAG